MGLQETIDETKEKLAEIEGTEVEESAVVEEVVVEVEAEAETDETTDEAETTDEVTEEPEADKPEAEPELDSTGYAKLRRELAAQKKLTAEAEAKANPEQNTTEANQTEVADNEVNDLLQERRVQKATQEFADLEEGFSANVPEYEGISNAYKAALYQSLRIQNPSKSHNQLLEATRNTLLVRAGEYVNKGLDPIQELFEEAKSLGIKAAPAKVAESQEEVIKPDLNKIAKNKAKNAGMVAAKGSGAGGQLTREGAADMTSGEWSKLSAEEKTRLLDGG